MQPPAILTELLLVLKLQQNWNEVERDAVTFTNNIQKVSYICLCMDTHVEAQLQAHTRAPAPEYYQ